MVAKEYLKKIARMESYIQSKKERLAVLKEMSSGISSPKFDDMPRNPNNEIKEDEKKLEHEKLYLLEAIGRIEEPEYQTILISRYFKHQSWDDIANSLFYTKRWLYSLHGRALERLDEELG